MKAEWGGQKLTSFLSLDRGMLLPLVAVSLAGTTVICCTGMLLFPSNLLVLLPQHSQCSVPSCPPICAPAWDPPSHPQTNEPLLPDSTCLLAQSGSPTAREWDQVTVETGWQLTRWLGVRLSWRQGGSYSIVRAASFSSSSLLHTDKKRSWGVWAVNKEAKGKKSNDKCHACLTGGGAIIWLYLLYNKHKVPKD